MNGPRRAKLEASPSLVAFLDRFAFWWGAPYPLLILALFAAPLLAGVAMSRR